MNNKMSVFQLDKASVTLKKLKRMLENAPKKWLQILVSKKVTLYLNSS